VNSISACTRSVIWGFGFMGDLGCYPGCCEFGFFL